MTGRETEVKEAKHESGVTNVAHVDYEKHNPVMTVLGDNDVIHVNLRKTRFGREKPQGR